MSAKFYILFLISFKKHEWKGHMHQIGKVLILLSVVSLGITILGALATYMTRDAVLDEMISNAENRNFEELEKRFVWEELRNNIKARIRSQKKAVGKLNLGNISSGPADNRIDEVVDYFVQPDNLPVLMALKDKRFKIFGAEDFVQSVGFASPFSWTASFGLPSSRVANVSKAVNNPALVSKVQSAMQVILVFELDGLTWKVTNIRLPLFMVPKRAYNRPLEQVLQLDIVK